MKFALWTLACLALTASAWVTPTRRIFKTTTRFSTHLFLSSEDASSSPAAPTTFREAEVLGLRLMQEGKHKEALEAFEKGVKLPGSRPDVKRTKRVSGPSPVGGSTGGTDSETVYTLDEFEWQAAHYNMACAHAKLQNIPESVSNLKLCFDNGFDNYATVRGDPDLSALQGTSDFEELMLEYEKKGTIQLPKLDFGGPPSMPAFPNPFGLFGKK